MVLHVKGDLCFLGIIDRLPCEIRKGGGAAPLTISSFSLAANF